MRRIIFIFLLAALLFGCKRETKTYIVWLDFCDNRPSKRISIEYHHEPSNSDLWTYKEAVPIFYANNEKYLNVCNINVVDEIDKD